MRVLDQEVDFRENATLLLRQHRPLVIAVVVTALLDLLTTVCFMALLGPEKEINMFIRFLAFSLGIVIGPIAGKSCQVFAVWAFSCIVPRLGRAICMFVIFFNVLAIMANTSLICEAYMRRDEIDAGASEERTDSEPVHQPAYAGPQPRSGGHVLAGARDAERGSDLAALRSSTAVPADTADAVRGSGRQ